MKQYVIDAFTDKVFGGNPAAVCVMNHWLPEETMLKIAKENNLSETAFAINDNGYYKLKWFTPGGEIDLCGHATLATAYVIMNYIEKKMSTISFSTLSGILTVEKKGDILEMDFPAYELKPIEITSHITEAIGIKPSAAYMGRDLLCIFEDENIVRNLVPDMEKLKRIDGLLLHVTACGKDTDCVSRSFAPKLNVNEDPVCGSGHCHIIPYWAKKLEKQEIIAYQASERGGTLFCRVDGSRVKLAGTAVLYSIADIFI